MRIAHVTATFPPYRGGTGNVCWHNARELARRGHEVHVYTAAMAGALRDEERQGVAIHRLRPLLRIGNAPVLPGLLGALGGFDVVHLHYPFFGGEITGLATWSKRIPLVVTYHQDVILSGGAGLVARIMRAGIGRLTLRTASRVLFTSEDYGRVSQARSLLRGIEERIGELPNGVDLAAFTPGHASSALRSHLDLKAEDRVVLLVASLDRAHYFKGVDVLLRAVSALSPAVRAILVGDGDLRGEYEALAARLGIGERVLFAGRVRDQELPDYYRLASVTALPSITMGEAFGLVLIESMACGTPVVASDIPGVRTVVDHGVDGLLIEAGSPTALAAAVREILSDEAGRREMGRAGRRKVEARYDWAQIGDRLEAIYQEVLRT